MLASKLPITANDGWCGRLFYVLCSSGNYRRQERCLHLNQVYAFYFMAFTSVGAAVARYRTLRLRIWLMVSQ